MTNIVKYTLIIPATLAIISADPFTSSSLTIPCAFLFALGSADHSVPSTSLSLNVGVGGEGIGMTQPPHRESILEKNTSENVAGKTERRLTVIWARGRAERFSAVTSVSAWRRMALEREELREKSMAGGSCC